MKKKRKSYKIDRIPFNCRIGSRSHSDVLHVISPDEFGYFPPSDIPRDWPIFQAPRSITKVELWDAFKKISTSGGLVPRNLKASDEAMRNFQEEQRQKFAEFLGDKDGGKKRLQAWQNKRVEELNRTIWAGVSLTEAHKEHRLKRSLENRTGKYKKRKSKFTRALWQKVRQKWKKLAAEYPGREIRYSHLEEWYSQQDSENNNPLSEPELLKLAQSAKYPYT